MKIIKLNHSTFLLKTKNKTILFDPGDYTISKTQNLKNIDLLIITHNHPDHLHIESIKNLILNNPNLHIITNTEVSKILLQQNINSEICDNNKITKFHDIKIESFDFDHVEIWKELPLPQNTAYLIDEEFYNPGDSFGIIDRKIKTCVFMLTGPATKISECLEFVLNQKPQKAIGIHDGMLNRITSSQKLPELILPQNNIEYQNLELDKEYDI